jgi:hypothetical protein
VRCESGSSSSDDGFEKCCIADELSVLPLRNLPAAYVVRPPYPFVLASSTRSALGHWTLNSAWMTPASSWDGGFRQLCLSAV